MNVPRYRRCQAVVIAPEERPRVILEDILAGRGGVSFEQSTVALAGHLDAAVTLTEEACALLLATSAQQWTAVPDDDHLRALIMRLVENGLLVLEHHAGEAAAQDDRLRSCNWWPLSAIHHRHSRWRDVDSAGDMVKRQLVTADDLVKKFGNPPAEAPLRREGAIALSTAMDDPLAEMMARRATCRNYDDARPLPLQTLAGILRSVLMAHGQVETTPGVRFLKKNVPSAGGLHPLEAYVIARNVEGLAPAIYHYHAVAHELSRLDWQPEDLSAFSLKLLSGQHWFATAHVQLVLVCRFPRNFWKYRNHAKAYRAVTLDVGHVSQALYTAATASDLGAFVTAAINDAEVEPMLGSDCMLEDAMAVCGFGWRAEEMDTIELDPNGKVWSLAQPRL